MTMGIIQKIEKKIEEEEALKFVIEELLPFWSDFFGKPQWMLKPKEGQKPEKIIEQYVNVIKPYRKDAVMQRAGEICVYRDTRSFPTPSHIRARLKFEDLSSQPQEKKSVVSGRSIESEYFEANRTSGLYSHCLAPDYTRAVKYVIDELLPEKIGFSEFQTIRYDYSAKVNLAERNGLFDDFNNILLKVYNRYHGIDEEQQMNSDIFDMGA